MRLVTSLDDFRPDPEHPLFLALGNFDGIHLGHQALLKKVTSDAETAKGTAVVFTFQDHPQHVLHPAFGRLRLLTSPVQRLFALNQMKIGICFFLPFTQAFSELSAEAFVEKILIERLQVHKVYLGPSARFGHDRRGDAALMEQLARRHGFQFEEIAPVEIDGGGVSSSRIRDLLQKGDLEKAARSLGRPFSLMVQVVPGEGRGKGLGFPTANLEVSGLTMPPAGVYPVKVRLVEQPFSQGEGLRTQELVLKASEDWKEGVLNYGSRPTFQKDPVASQVAEVFILKPPGDLYGRVLEVVFYPQLRGERTFDSPEALKQQIRRDIEAAERCFATRQKNRFTKAVN